jgi:hypothetical protein
MNPARGFCAALLLLLSCPVVHAQRGYLGADLTLLTDGHYTSPLFGVQVGVPLGSCLELRGAFETVVLGSSLSADLLYRVSFETHDIYLGAGAAVLFAPAAYPTVAAAQATPLGDPRPALHGVGGLELRTGSFGVFGEVQPILTLEPVRLGYTKVRSGLNLYL